MIEYWIRNQDRDSWLVSEKGNQIAEMLKSNDREFVLRSKIGLNLVVSRIVDGELRPFSLTFRSVDENKEVLKIKHHVFFHHNSMYLLAGLPEGRLPSSHVQGARFICRLDHLDYCSHSEIDVETWNKLRKHRGVEVGEFIGLGQRGHKVILQDELSDIALPVSVACYLVYSSA